MQFSTQGKTKKLYKEVSSVIYYVTEKSSDSYGDEGSTVTNTD